jgi:hypothetical protein
MNSIQRWAGLVAVCGAALVCGGDKDEKGPKGKPLGPEWKKEEGWFKKKVEGTAKRALDEWKDSSTQYKFDLPHNTLWVVERDDERLLDVLVEVKEERGRVQFKLDRDEKGKTYRCAVFSDLIAYYDFDSDGIFDAYMDSRVEKGNPSKHFVLVDNAFVEVVYQLGGFKYGPGEGPAAYLSLDRQTEYKFADGKWKGGPK